MAFPANQVHQVAAVEDAAEGNHVPVLPASGAGVDNVHSRLESEERDWANLLPDAVREISEKLLAMDATEYFRLRAVCKPWRSSTHNRPTWEPCFFPRNWAMLREDEDEDEDDDDVPADLLTLPRRRRFINVGTGATLWIQLPSFEEYGAFLAPGATAEGLLIFYCTSTDTVRLFNPLTTATAVLPGFSSTLPELEEEYEVTVAGIVADRRPEGDPMGVVPNVVLVTVSRVWPRMPSTVLLCSKPGDDHWGTIDAGIVEADGGGDVLAFGGGLSLHGRFYIPTILADVVRVELFPQPHLVYVVRPPGRHAECRCPTHDVTSYLVPSLDDDNETLLMVRVFDDDTTNVLKVHLGNGSYTPVPPHINRTIFLPGLTLLTDRFPSLAEEDEGEGNVHLNERIEDYIGDDDI